MKENHNNIDRRNFLKTIGAAGLGSVFASAKVKAAVNGPNVIDSDAPKKEQESESTQVPRRKLGKTGVEVPCLALGTMFNLVDNQLILLEQTVLITKSF